MLGTHATGYSQPDQLAYGGIRRSNTSIAPCVKHTFVSITVLRNQRVSFSLDRGAKVTVHGNSQHAGTHTQGSFTIVGTPGCCTVRISQGAATVCVL